MNDLTNHYYVPWAGLLPEDQPFNVDILTKTISELTKRVEELESIVKPKACVHLWVPLDDNIMLSDPPQKMYQCVKCDKTRTSSIDLTLKI